MIILAYYDVAFLCKVVCTNYTGGQNSDSFVIMYPLRCIRTIQLISSSLGFSVQDTLTGIFFDSRGLEPAIFQ